MALFMPGRVRASCAGGARADRRCARCPLV